MGNNEHQRVQRDAVEPVTKPREIRVKTHHGRVVKLVHVKLLSQHGEDGRLPAFQRIGCLGFLCGLAAVEPPPGADSRGHDQRGKRHHEQSFRIKTRRKSVSPQITLKPRPGRCSNESEQHGEPGENDQWPRHHPRAFVGSNVGQASRLPIGRMSIIKRIRVACNVVRQGTGRRDACPTLSKKHVTKLPGHVERGQQRAEQAEIKRPPRRRPGMSCMQDFVFAPEPGKEQGHPAQCHHSDRIGHKRDRHEFSQFTHATDVLLVMTAMNH